MNPNQRRVLFFTGAGISADSGLSTFRDNEDGLWTKYNPDVVATMATFEENKELVFQFYNERRVLLQDVQPNKAHAEIGKLQQQYGEDSVQIFTQNIDDLFEKAGCVDVQHVHGKFTEMKCLSNPNHVYDIGHSTVTTTERCPVCGGGVKPGVIFFGEDAPLYPLMYNTFKLSTENDLIVVIGTSGNVVNMAYVVGLKHLQYGGKRILCNKDSNDWIDYELFDDLLFGKAIDCIDEIVTAVNDWMSQK
jgi:NAD-dependent deacetylase